MRIRLVLAAALLIASCAPKAPIADASPAAVAEAPSPVRPASVAPDAAACTTQGGTIRPVCRMQKPMCVIAYADAGKACRSDSDCSGKCRAPDDAVSGQQTVGMCAANNDPCGCSASVRNGVATPKICRD